MKVPSSMALRTPSVSTSHPRNLPCSGAIWFRSRPSCCVAVSSRSSLNTWGSSKVVLLGAWQLASHAVCTAVERETRNLCECGNEASGGKTDANDRDIENHLVLWRVCQEVLIQAVRELQRHSILGPPTGGPACTCIVSATYWCPLNIIAGPLPTDA